MHGFRTIFPVPLAQACSWDMEAIETSERIAATEATAMGINWTYAPMVDIARQVKLYMQPVTAYLNCTR